MELKKILGKLGQPEPVSNFLAVEISNETVKTAVWRVVDKKTEVVRVGSLEKWKGNETDDLVAVVDKSLSPILDGLEQEPNEVVFGLVETWVSDEGIAKAKKPLLKALADKLELKPVGFVVTTEAITHYLTSLEGGPVSAILLLITEAEIVVTVVNQSKIIGTQVVGTSGNLSQDVEEGLARFSGIESLPARMIIYEGSGDLEAVKQTLLNYEWQKRLNFLHFPKVEYLEPDASVRAVAVAGGAEVAKSLGLKVEGMAVVDLGETPQPEAVPFGFEKVETEPEITSEVPVEDNKVETETVDNFLLDGREVRVSKNDLPQRIEGGDEAVETESVQKLGLGKRWKGKITGLLGGVKLPAFSKIGKLPNWWWLGGGVVVLLLITAGLAYWNIPRAKVSLYLKPRVVEKTLEFNLDTAGGVLDAANLTLPAQKEEIEVEGEKTISTTGEALLGERAKGLVTIYNRTESPRTLEAGTLVALGDLEFSLDESVTIASASTQENDDFSTTVVPSSQDAAVTAEDIGDNYNLAAETQLTVANFSTSSFVAEVKSGLSGGFAREIRAVSEEDKEKILEELMIELSNQAESEGMEANGVKGVVVGEPEVILEEYSKEIDDEGDELGLKLKLMLPTYLYSKGDLRLLLENKFEADIPDGFKLNDQEIEVLVETVEVEEDNVLVEAVVKMKLVADLDTNEIIENIRGKYPTLTEEYFRSIPNYSKVDIEFSVHLPQRLKTFPKKSSNITVEVLVEDN